MARLQLRNAGVPPATPFEKAYVFIVDDKPGDTVLPFPDGIVLYSADAAGDGTASPYIMTEDGTVIDLAAGGGGGGGTVTTISVVTANGISGSVATATTTPAITLTLGAITPTSVAASGTVTGSNLSGTNTGDQTTISGNVTRHTSEFSNSIFEKLSFEV